MIVKTLEQVQKYLPSFNLKVKVDRISDFLDRAQLWLTTCIMGQDIETTLEADIPENTTDTHEKLRTLASRVICELAYETMIGEMDLQLSEAGFVVQNNQQMSPASQQRTDRLVQTLRSRTCTDCDNLVTYLMKTPSYYWTNTEQFTYLTDAFIPTLQVMRQYTGSYQITRWQEFYELVPKMVEALRDPVASYISTEEVDALLTAYRSNTLNENEKKALRWIRMATMAQVIGYGNFEHFAIEARQWMLKHESDFPAFVNSDRYQLPSPFNPGEGTVANFL